MANSAYSQEDIPFNKYNSMENNQFKNITIRRVYMQNEKPSAEEIESAFNMANIPFNDIDVINWPGFDYNPKVKFRIAYSTDELYIKYYVLERDLKAVFGADSASMPYKDSCCEFFVEPVPGRGYYNLELNCIGKGTFSYKEGDRKVRFGSDVLNKIRRSSSLGDKPIGIIAGAENEYKEWTLTVAIPFELFSEAKMIPSKGNIIRANFYKCGDEMPQKHYFSWNPIDTPKPNFHTPAFFGYLKFE